MIEFSHITNIKCGSQKPIIRTYYMRVHVFGCSPRLRIVSHVGADPYTRFCKQVHGIIFKNFVFRRTKKWKYEKIIFFCVERIKPEFFLVHGYFGPALFFDRNRIRNIRVNDSHFNSMWRAGYFEHVGFGQAVNPHFPCFSGMIGS